MKQKTIAIRCITDEQKGFGHLSRCLSLGYTLKKNGYHIVFIINKNNSAIKEINKKNFQYILIPQLISYRKESDFIIKIMNSRKYDAIIIDMREFSENLTKQLFGNIFKTILLDDVWCDTVYSDILFNATTIKKFHKYKKKNINSKLFLGSKYFITNSEFQKHKKKIYEIHDKKIYDIVVSMGGSDSNELTLKIIKSIMDLKNIKIEIIIGPFYKDLRKLRDLIKNKKHISIVDSPPKIWKQFKKSDIVIANAGSTLFELAIQKVPTMCIPVIKHQILYAEKFSMKGFSINLGLWKYLKSNTIRKTLVEILENKEKRRKISALGDKLVDGKGLLRTTNVISRLLNDK